jgi:hypothetical protein
MTDLVMFANIKVTPEHLPLEVAISTKISSSDLHYMPNPISQNFQTFKGTLNFLNHFKVFMNFFTDGYQQLHCSIFHGKRKVDDTP